MLITDKSLESDVSWLLFISHLIQSKEPEAVLQPGHWEELVAGPVMLSGVRCEESVILTASTGLSLF